MRITSDVDLSEREAAFVDALARGARPTRAALVAGYSAPHAANLIRKPRIRAALLAISSNASAVLDETEAR